MISNITWSTYWAILIVCVIIYYAYVLWVYYRYDIFKRLLVRKAIVATGPLTRLPTDQINDKLFPVVQSFTSEVSAYLENASQSKAVKNEVIFGLQQIAKKNHVIKDSHYQPAINSLIEFEARDKCGIHLSEAEIRQVWLV